MKLKLALLALSACVCAGVAAPFQNLNFYEGNTSHVDAEGFGPTAELLPAWQVAYPSGVWSSIFYNSSPLGDGWVALLPKENFGGSPGYPVFGLYSLAVDPAVSPGSLNPIMLSQRGDVPGDASSITFLNYGAPFELRLNNTLIPLTYQGGSPFDTRQVRLASGDVSAFAGLNVEMTFSAFYEPTVPRVFIHGLDSISFVVPEPSTWLMLGFGAATLWAVRHSCRRNTG